MFGQSRRQTIARFTRFSVCLSLLTATTLGLLPSRARADMAVFKRKDFINPTGQVIPEMAIGEFTDFNDSNITGSISFAKLVMLPAFLDLSAVHYLIGDWETNQIYHLGFSAQPSGLLGGFDSTFGFSDTGVFDVDLDFMGQPVSFEQEMQIDLMPIEDVLALIPNRSTFDELLDSIDIEAGGVVPVAMVSIEGIVHDTPIPEPASTLSLLALGTLGTGLLLKRKKKR